MKNLTVALDDETYRRVRIRAAEAGRSLSSIVRDYLNDFGAGMSEFERLHHQELRLREERTGFRAGPSVNRDDLYDRSK